MKKFIIIVTALLLVLPAAAQRKAKRAAQPVKTVTVAEAMESYDFSLAEELLEKKIAELKKKKQPTVSEEAMLESARKSEIKLHATEQVTIIDSLVLPKNEVLQQIKLSEECGSIMSCDEFFQTKGNAFCTLFMSELGNRIVYSEANKQGHLRLKEKSLIGGEWSMEHQLKGFNEEESDNFNFPFMLSDGITMYYAAECEESLGGYDIFMTRYDADGGQFLAPENIGMPFNSPANDYLLVIDEYQDLGWFVSDRYQPEDKVCLYTFIPNATRRIYNEEQIGRKQLASLARIASIKDTWKDMNAVNKAKQRLADARSTSSRSTAKERRELTFILNDSKTCYRFTDFHDPLAQEKARLWLGVSQDLDIKKRELTSLRDKYAAANEAGKVQMRSKILQVEADIERLSADKLNLEKEIRRHELNNQ